MRYHVDAVTGKCFSITSLCLNAVPNLICILLRICVCKFNRLIIVFDHFRCYSQIIIYRRILLNWFEATLRHVSRHTFFPHWTCEALVAIILSWRQCRKHRTYFIWFKFISVADLFWSLESLGQIFASFFWIRHNLIWLKPIYFTFTISISLVFGVQFRNVSGKEVKICELLRGYRWMLPVGNSKFVNKCCSQ